MPLRSEALTSTYWYKTGAKGGQSCGTDSPWPIGALFHDATTTGKGYWSKDPDHPIGPLPPTTDTPYYGVGGGGLLDGTIDIPAFTGCLVGTEDVSPLLTTSVSGPGNPTMARQFTTSTTPVPAPFPIPTRPAS